MRTSLCLLAAAGLIALAAGCDDETEPVGGDGGGGADARRITWNADIGPLLASECASNCHRAANKASYNNYAMDSYAEALGPGGDTTPNVIPGNASSKLLTFGHAGSVSGRVRPWIVDFAAAEN